MKKIIESPNSPEAIGPYSQGVRAGDFLYVSGQMHLFSLPSQDHLPSPDPLTLGNKPRHMPWPKDVVVQTWATHACRATRGGGFD